MALASDLSVILTTHYQLLLVTVTLPVAGGYVLHAGDLADGLLEWLDSRLLGSLVGPPVKVHYLGLLLANQVVLGVVGAQPLLVVLAVVNPP